MKWKEDEEKIQSIEAKGNKGRIMQGEVGQSIDCFESATLGHFPRIKDDVFTVSSEEEVRKRERLEFLGMLTHDH